MGKLLHLFDFSCENMAKKVFSHKDHDDGLEAPRNSFELQVETFPRYDATENPTVEENWHEEGCYPVEASMKKLINEELSKHSSTRSNGPSIVARLMGMDMLPEDTKPVVQPKDKKNESKGAKLSKKEKSRRGSKSKSHSLKLKSFNSFYDYDERDADQLSNTKKLKPREHPQEEELQKFKQEFLARQAARFKEYTKVIDISEQFIAQENLNKRKLELYSVSGRSNNDKNPEDIGGDKVELLPTDHKNYNPIRSKALARDLERSNLVTSDMQVNQSSVPTKIVILKPGPEKICNPQDSWTSSSDMVEEKAKDSIEGFLEEVRERLKFELQGKSFKGGAVARGKGIETPFSEKPSNEKRVTRAGGSVTRGPEMSLLRSESTRSYRNDFFSNEPSSPEFISRDTRRLLAERMKNILRVEPFADSPVILGDHSRPSILDGGRAGQKQRGDTLRAKNDIDCWDSHKHEQGMQTRSFRHRPDHDGLPLTESPRNLVRSLSAPVSGTSFGKLLLEDRHILTGAHIRRKHEGADKSFKDLRKSKKERFNLKEKVSHFRYSLTLRGSLFGRKIQSATVRHGVEHNSVKDIRSGPTVMSTGEGHDNFTEVPPSPVSVCSSAHEDFWRPADNVSPASTPDMISGENITVPHVFREISSNLNELRRQLNQLDSNGPQDTFSADHSVESEIVNLDDPAEAYVRDLLVASGLYDGSSDIRLTRWDPLAKPISNSIYEEVEVSYRKLEKDTENLSKDRIGQKEHRKVLLDLLNEALSMVLGPSVTLTKFRRKIMQPSMLPPSRGKKLLDNVWEIISTFLHPPTGSPSHTLDDMVSRDLESTPWSRLIDDEVILIGREVESLIIGDLLEDVVTDIYS